MSSFPLRVRCKCVCKRTQKTSTSISMTITREYRIAGLMAVSAMFTLAGYEFIRSSSTVLFKSAWGADRLPLVMAAMPLVVLAGVALYGWILNRLGPRRTLLVTSLGSSLMILACYLVLLTGSKAITPVLFLFKEFYIVLLIEQYWSYINSSLKPQTARKVNGPITGIAGTGAAIGGTLVGLGAESLGTETLVLLAALALLPGTLVSDLAYRLHGEPAAPAIADGEKSGKRTTLGLGLFKHNPVLLALLSVVLVTQVVAAVLDLKFQGLLSAAYVGEQDRETAFQGWFWGTLNSVVLVLQFVIAPLLLSFFALRWVHLLMPLVHLAAVIAAIMAPSIFTVGLAFFLFKAFDYSVFRAAKEVLYVPLGFEERYRAKEVIDVFGYRTGKGASSAIIVVAQKAGLMMTQYYLAIALVMVLIWLSLVFPLTRKREAGPPSPPPHIA